MKSEIVEIYYKTIEKYVNELDPPKRARDRRSQCAYAQQEKYQLEQ